MARKKKAQAQENTEGWLTTYADLISLLLCFFVLMYAASTPDEAKMQWILQSFSQLTGEYINPVVSDDEDLGTEEDGLPDDSPLIGQDIDGDITMVPGTMPMAFDDLFNWVSEAVESNNLDMSIEVSQASGRLYIRFDSEIMFEPDSYELLPSGRNALNVIYPGIKAIQDYVKTVEVAGHTADVPGSVRIDDWFISSLRAVSVANYLDYGQSMVSHDKFRTIGYAQNDPYYSNETEEGRAKNRRVELVVIRNDFNLGETDVLTDILKYDYDLGPIPGGVDDPRGSQPGTHDRTEQIREAIEEKYGTDFVSPELGDETGPTIPGLPGVTDEMLDPGKSEDAEEGSGSDGES